MTAHNDAHANLTALSRAGLELFSLAILHGSSTYQTRPNWTELFKLNSLVSISVDLGEFAHRPGAEGIGVEGIPAFVIPTTPSYFAAEEQQTNAAALTGSVHLLAPAKTEREYFFILIFSPLKGSHSCQELPELFFKRSPENLPMCTFLF